MQHRVEDLCLGPYYVLRGVAVSYERGTPVLTLPTHQQRRHRFVLFVPVQINDMKQGGDNTLRAGGSGRARLKCCCCLHLSEFIDYVVLESQLLHKIVDSLFTITNQNLKLTVMWGG